MANDQDNLDIQENEVEAVMEADTSNKNVELAIEELDASLQSVTELLKDNYDTVLIGITTKFDMMKNQLRMIAGIPLELKSSQHKFEPVTNFMGTPIERRDPLDVENLSPNDTERKIFREKVTRLSEGLDDLSDDQILESYKNDQKVVRGVAKLAGVEDFKTAEINTQFIQSIRTAREQKASADAARTAAENKLTVDEEENND